MEFAESEIINSNGQRYRVGWDEHGWFSLVRVMEHPETGEWVREPQAEIVSVTPDDTDTLIDLIERAQAPMSADWAGSDYAESAEDEGEEPVVSDGSDDGGLAETIRVVNKQDPDEPTYLRADDVKQRMKTRGGTATNIADAFGSVESLVEACEAGDDLTEYEGIGPATAESIQEWWDNRESRERMASNQTVTSTGKQSARVTFYKSWANALGMEDDEDG